MIPWDFEGWTQKGTRKTWRLQLEEKNASIKLQWNLTYYHRMRQYNLILGTLKAIFEQWIQKLVSASKGLCLKDAMKEEQVISDKIDTDLKVDLKRIGYKNVMEKIMLWRYKVWCLNN